MMYYMFTPFLWKIRQVLYQKTHSYFFRGVLYFSMHVKLRVFMYNNLHLFIKLCTTALKWHNFRWLFTSPTSRLELKCSSVTFYYCLQNCRMLLSREKIRLWTLIFIHWIFACSYGCSKVSLSSIIQDFVVTDSEIL